ncbi:microfibril-associated glycoprotein 4-like [Mytilus galloprovincialis]|uniref:microfibril-associated glycoprotein 4-like n=1 Tax=Mytilus galloprovincialis TaxID=29158 RepID=UPI003F7BB511
MKLEEVLLSLEIDEDVKQYIESMKGNLTVNIREEIKDYFDDMKHNSSDAISKASRTAEENIKKVIKDYVNDMKQKFTDSISEANRTAEENIKKEIKDYFDDLKQNSTDAISEAHIHGDCSDLYRQKVRSGVYKIFPEGRAGFNVYCDMETDGGGWTVFQHRQDGKVDFFRGWTEYVKGFGDVNTEFWLGNDNLHDLTSQGSYELRVDLEDFHGDKAYATYSTFNIGDKATNFILTVNGYSGTAGDALKYHNKQAFSTKDKDNDKDNSRNCADRFKGGWWYESCFSSNLNGMYLGNKIGYQGISWMKWKVYQSMKTTSMMIRRV